MKKSLLALFICGLFFTSTTAQLPDLPGGGATSYNPVSMPVGSYVIAMDNTLQGNGTLMNLKAYGLIVTLLNNHRSVKWVIQPGKLHNGIDFTVDAALIKPSASGVATYSFRAGPFVIFAQDTTGIAQLIDNYNAANNTGVKVYRTAATVTVDVRYDLYGFKPKAAILNDGKNWPIHQKYFIESGIPATNYFFESSGHNLLVNCYTFASEPHNDQSPDTVIAEIRQFVENGGNFLAQCHAVETYENNNFGGHFQSSTNIENGAGGTKNADIKSNEVAYPNADMSYAQYEGDFDMSLRGFMQNWRLISGSSWINNNYKTTLGTLLPNVTSSSVSKLMPIGRRGGMVFYLGNHDFNTDKTYEINGIRQYMNAFLTPSNLLGSINFAAVVTCPATLADPAILHVGSTYGPTGAYPLRFDLYADTSAPFGRYNLNDVLLGSVTLNAAGDTGSITVTGQFRKNTNYVVRITPVSTCMDAQDFVPNFCSSSLPVVFKDFTVTRNRDMVDLKWVTATEINTRGYEIQRWENGQWVNAGFVPSQAEGGNSVMELTYRFSEINMSRTLTQYRVRETAWNGNFTYSNIRSVAGVDDAGTLRVYPNPAEGGFITVMVSGGEDGFDLVVVDMSGRIVRQYSGLRTMRFSMEGFQSGVYCVKAFIRKTGQNLVTKLVVNK